MIEESFPDHPPVRDLEIPVARRLGVAGAGAGSSIKAGSEHDLTPGADSARNREVGTLQKKHALRDSEVLLSTANRMVEQHKRSRGVASPEGFVQIDEPTLPISAAVGRVPLPHELTDEVTVSRRTPVPETNQNDAPTEQKGDSPIQISFEETQFIFHRLTEQRNDAQTLNAVLQGRIDLMTQNMQRLQAELAAAKAELAAANPDHPADH